MIEETVAEMPIKTFLSLPIHGHTEVLFHAELVSPRAAVFLDAFDAI